MGRTFLSDAFDLLLSQIKSDRRTVEHTHPEAGIRTGVKAKFAELVQAGRTILAGRESAGPV